MKIIKIILIAIISILTISNSVLAVNCGSIISVKNDGSNPTDPEDTEPGNDYSNLPSSTSTDGSSSSKKPNLYVKELSFKDGKTKYYDDEDIKIDGYVGNNGKSVDKKIKKVAFKLYRYKGEKENGDTKEVASENMKGENLKSGCNKHEQFSDGAPSEEDRYQFYAIADAKGAVSESNENDNKSGIIACRVHKRPDIYIYDLKLNDGQTTFIQGEVPYAEVVFSNSGGEPFEDVKVSWYLDGNYFADDNMRHWNIEHNDKKDEDVYLTQPLSVGTHTLRVCADFSKDKDQSNNCREITFTVVAPEPILETPEVIDNPPTPPDTDPTIEDNQNPGNPPNQDPAVDDTDQNPNNPPNTDPGMTDGTDQTPGNPPSQDPNVDDDQDSGSSSDVNVSITNNNDTHITFGNSSSTNSGTSGNVGQDFNQYFSQYFNSDPNHTQYSSQYSSSTQSQGFTATDDEDAYPQEDCFFFNLRKTSDNGKTVNYQMTLIESFLDDLAFIGQKSPGDNNWIQYPVTQGKVYINDWPKGQPIKFAICYIDEFDNKFWFEAELCPKFFDENSDPDKQNFIAYLN